MRHLQRVSVLVLALALATAVAAACASGSTRKPKATLTLASRNPVVVTGRHFTPRVKVQVVLRTGARQSRSAVPNGHGVFTATFSAVIDRCTSWSVRATQPGQAPLLIRGAAKPACPVAGAA
jgi:hypothetical protein